jgi:molybdopterin-guanine dinucleotide biosynthesis protein A
LLVSDQRGSEGALLQRDPPNDKRRRGAAGAGLEVVGAIFAGGQARRFGSDKAVALLDGRPLIAHVADRLAAQCACVVVVGRAWPGLPSVADLPTPGLGPLGALAGALAWAQDQGFGAVLTSGCDLPDLPLDLLARLSPAPAMVRDQPLLGLWPSALNGPLIQHLRKGRDRSVRRWAAVVGARSVPLEIAPTNINTAADLAAYRAIRPADPQSSR